MPAYTDADVQAACEAIHEATGLWVSEVKDEACLVLDTVAPAIAARALREAAEAGVSSPTFLRARADSIESGTT